MRAAWLFVLALAASPALAQDAAVAALPGGASAVSERHGSWSVDCALSETGKDCSFSQSAGNPDSGAALVAIDAGIQLGIDGQQLGPALPFLTCVESGCLVPLAFDEVSLSALKVGTSLEITGIKVDGGETVTVPLSLAGFTAAYNRTAELAK